MAQTINVNLTPGLFMPALHYSQGDVGRQFIINLSTSDGTPIPSGATVKMEATKPSGFGFSVSGSLSGSVATFTTTAVMTDECGRFPAEIKLTSGSTVIGTANFWLDGEKDPHPEGTTDGQQGSVIPALTLLVERAESASQAAIAAQTAAEAAAANAEEHTASVIESWLDEHPEATTTVQDGSITDVKISRNSTIAFTAEGGLFYASQIGLTENNANGNVSALAAFMENHPNATIYVNNGMVFPFDEPIVLTNNVHLIGAGQLKYTGPATDEYFVTTYATGSSWNNVIPQNSHFEINVDCNRLAQGIYFSGGIHNEIVANIKDAKGNGYYLASGHGYENVHSVSVMNDNKAVFADSVGVYCNKSDEVFDAIFTRNCNIGIYLNGSGLVKMIHSWCFGDYSYPNSVTAKLNASRTTLEYVYSDTMQYPIVFERLLNDVSIGDVICFHNDDAVSSSVASDNKYRPWKALVQPTIGDKPDVSIGSLSFPTINGSLKNTLNPLEPFDGFVQIGKAMGLMVYGCHLYVPLCESYATTGSLTDTPSGYNNTYASISAYRNERYKWIELKRDYPATDPIVFVSIGLSNWVAKWFAVDKTQIGSYTPT